MDSKTGDILAMVGSYDYNDEKYGKFNAALGDRQPGSSIKPLTYAVALEKGYTPATVLMDLKTTFASKGSKDYIPVNYDGRFRGPVQMRFALGNSLNIPAVKMIAMVGVKDFLTKADEMGLHSFAPTQENLGRFGLAITLGGGESNLVDMTSMYTIFARGGIKKGTQSLLEISDAKGKVIYKKKDSTEKRVLTPETSFLISHMLSDNVARTEAFGPSSYLNIPGKTVSVKTGTTDDKRDNYAIGYTKDVTVGVWVGNNDNSPMNQRIASGITGASPIWNRIMKELLKKYSDGIMDKPDRVKAIEIDSYLGGLPKDGYPKRSEYFVEGTEPKDQSPFYKKIKISKSTGKLANDVEIRSGNYDEKEYIVITENDPVSTDGKNRWQEAIDEWARSQTDDKYKPPTEKSDGNSEDLIVSIRKPGDKSTVDSNNVEINAKIASLTSIKEVKLLVNNKEIKAWGGDTREINETVNLPDGTYEIKVYAKNEKYKVADSVIRIGVKKAWDSAPPAPTSTPVLTNTPTP
jgi:membrane carboxypeptidase/penicillin-binding protein PbpC